MRQFTKIFLQVLLIAGIFGFLFWSAATATDDDGKNIFVVLCEQPKRWHFLAAAFVVQFFAVCLTIIRWRWLVRTLGLECSYKEAFRFGFLGIMLNLAPLGIVGGDAIKAVLLAQRNPDYKSQAVASVFIDRFVGLFIMFLLGLYLIYHTGFNVRPEFSAQTLIHIIVICTLASLTVAILPFFSFFSKGHFESILEKIPLCGKLLGKLTRALLLYRHHKWCLLLCSLFTIPVHFCFGLSLYWVAIALFPAVPDAVTHIMLHSTTNITTMIPLAAGPYELVFEQLYQLYGMNVGMGLIVSLMFRLIIISVAVAGMFYYYGAVFRWRADDLGT